MSDVLAHLDDALERVVRLRERLLRDPDAVDRAQRLALVFASEAHAWSQLFELSEQRLVWRAALVAEQVARRNAAAWARRAMVETPWIARPESRTDGSTAGRSPQGRDVRWAA